MNLENVTFDSEATIVVDGETVNAKGYICAHQAEINYGLEALSKIGKNGLGKLIFLAAINYLETVLANFCKKGEKKD
jgi:hypothetical protein